jgi:DNA-binding NarL/FixJ family response regulator
MKNTPNPITVVVYEDTKDIREGFTSLISCFDDIKVIGAFADAEKVAQQTDELRPDVILMDIQMQKRNGIEATAIVKEISPDTEVIILTHHSEDENVFNALKYGASGYLIKDADTDIAGAVRMAASGGAPINTFIARKALEYFQRQLRSKPSIDYGLSKRELEVLESLIKGNSYKEVCSELFISLETVRTHTKSIYKKLQVRSKTEAVLAAIQNKII